MHSPAAASSSSSSSVARHALLYSIDRLRRAVPPCHLARVALACACCLHMSWLAG